MRLLTFGAIIYAASSAGACGVCAQNNTRNLAVTAGALRCLSDIHDTVYLCPVQLLLASQVEVRSNLQTSSKLPTCLHRTSGALCKRHAMPSDCVGVCCAAGAPDGAAAD